MISDSRIVEVVRDKSEPVCTASDVAGELPIGQRAVQKRLQDLANSGEVNSRQVGAKALIWWVDGSVERTSHERTTSVERTDSDERTPEPTDGGGVRSNEVRTSEDVRSNESDAISEVLEGWRPGKVGTDDRERRIQGGRAAIGFIREKGEHVQAQDIKDALFEEHKIGDQKPDSWYDRVALEAINLAKAEGLVYLKSGDWEYSWTGPE